MGDAGREARYWAKVDRRGNDECWPWLAFRNPHGYGMFRAADGTRLAHRWAYEQFVGELGNLHVCHTCDNPACQNPRHWFAGTPADNAADKVSKGRQSRAAVMFGTRNPASKLTPGDVAAIRSAYSAGARQRAIAADFGISQIQVSRIVRGEQWAS